MRRTLILVLGLIACAGWAEPSAPRTIVTTFHPIHLAVMNVTAGVAGIRIVNLAAPSVGCLHDYHPTPRDLAAISGASVLVANGLGMESFLADAIKQYPGLNVIEAGAGIHVIIKGGETNAHVWVSPSRYAREVRAIGEGLAAWDPVNSALYRTNSLTYARSLESLQAKMVADLKSVTTRDIVTFHEAFAYFAEEFNLRVVGVVEREPGSEPSAGELAGLSRRIKSFGVKAIFAEPQYSAKAADVLARETGARVYCLDPVVSGDATLDAYVVAMERNLAELVRALR